MSAANNPLINNSSDNSLQLLTWRPLHQINLYRFILAIGFLVAFYNSQWMGFLGSQDTDAFIATAMTLLVSSLIFIVMGRSYKPIFYSQVIITNASDILLITLLAHYSGGLSSSLSILLIINVTTTGAFLKDRDSFLFAALASIAILAEQTISMMDGVSQASDYSHAGLLGIVFFGTSFLSSILSKRLRESEQLAFERKADIISLEILNEDIIQNMRTGIIVVDYKGQIRMANSSAETLLGDFSLQDSPQLKNILPALDRRLLEWRKQPYIHHKAIHQEHGLPDIQPGFRNLHRTNDTLIFLEDATQLNQRFQQIKLASLGKLTASIAHEIRNPLSAINHAAQLLNESELDAADSKLTQIITTQVLRLDKIIQNVLQLSRQQQNTPETLVLYQWLISFKEEFCSTNDLQPHQLEIKSASEDIQIIFDSSHLHQVIGNLISNAISHNDKPLHDVKIKINSGYDQQQHQPYLEIIDNGPGIDSKLTQQIFDPFFTTSPKGTGLGLYISKEIIESNRAKMQYIQTQEAGSCFRIQFLLSPQHT